VTVASEGFVLRRILVALDTSPHSLAALEAAVELAVSTRAELVGLFVEDVNLLRLARLPVAQQLSLGSGSGQPFERGALEAELRALALRARGALESAGARRGVRVSFRVTRGAVTSEVLAAASDADLLILGWASRPLSRRRRLGGTARAVARGSPRSVLLLSYGATLPGPVVVVCERGSGRALETAAGLAAASGAGLAVVPRGDSEEEASRLRAEVETALAGRGIAAEYRRAVTGGAAALRRALRGFERRLLVLSAGSPVLDDDESERLLDEIGGALLLVR
jgi:nucleotide-binding universal stress UspA family protein